jgi:transcriptional regulator GlxA family with amidase domain
MEHQRTACHDAHMTKRIGILVFDDVDLLDVGGPYEVFLTAGRLRTRAGLAEPFEILTIGPDTGPVVAYGGIGLVPSHDVAGAGRLDVVVVPGAVAIDEVANRPAVREAVAELLTGSELVSSVCTGSFLLADAGALDGIDWTTHWEDVGVLAERLGSTRGVVAAWVDAGSVVTGGGLSNGIGMALHLVDRLEDRDLALATARQIDFRWDPNGSNVVGSGD